MHRRAITLISILALATGTGYIAGCSNSVKPPPTPQAQFPETELTFAPLQGDTTLFRVHFYWNGFDKDGEVIRFRYAIDADTALPDTVWHTTTAKDTILKFLVDPVHEIETHTFEIASEDNSGRI